MKARAALVVLTLSATAGAEDDFVTARLEWQRAADAETCMSGDELERAVTRRLARNPFVDGSSNVIVKGRVAPSTEPSGWVAELELVSERGVRIGTRTIRTEADHCSALDESLPLVLALMIDIPRAEVLRAEQALEPAPPPAAEPKPAPAPARSRPAPSTPIALPPETHAPRRPWRVQSALFATSAVGLLPGVAFGGGVTLGIEPPTFWLTELDAIFWLPARADGEPRGDASYRLITIGLFLCPIAVGSTPLRVDVCAGQRVGRLDGDASDFDLNQDQVRLTYALGARARGWLTLAGPVRALIGLGIEAPLARDKFFYTEEGSGRTELFRMAPVVATAELGLGLSFP